MRTLPPQANPHFVTGAHRFDYLLWLETMPLVLVPFYEQLFEPEFGVCHKLHVAAANEALVQNVGTEEGAIRVLARWYGGGSGRHVGYPLYETLPRHLLEAFSTSTLVRAASGAGHDAPVLDGAARLFASWDFRTRRRRLPTLLIDRLRVHVESRGNLENTRHFGQVFRRRPASSMHRLAGRA